MELQLPPGAACELLLRVQSSSSLVLPITLRTPAAFTAQESHSQLLLALAPRAQFKLIAGAGHADLQEFEAYRAAVRAALPGPR